MNNLSRTIGVLGVTMVFLLLCLSVTSATNAPRQAVNSSGMWTNITSSAGLMPHPSTYSSMAYDSVDGYTVLFGGFYNNGGIGGSSVTEMNQTWILKNGTWFQLHPKVSPTARYGASMTFDAADGCVVMFGGGVVSHRSGGFTPTNTTWEFVGGNWTQVVGKGPVAMGFSAMTYDATDKYVVMFGGYSGSRAFATTWAFHGGVWTLLNGSKVQPTARDMSQMTYNTATSNVLLFGGRSITGKNLVDTWTFVNGTWSRVSTKISPSYSSNMGGMIYDPNVGAVVFIGDKNATSFVSESWTFSNGVWSVFKVTPPSYPIFALVYDSTISAEVEFNALSYTWTYS